MDRNFKSRLYNLSDIDTLKFMLGLKSFDIIDIQSVYERKSFLSFNYIFSQIIKQNFISLNNTEDIDFHISESGGGYSPYFALQGKYPNCQWGFVIIYS